MRMPINVDGIICESDECLLLVDPGFLLEVNQFVAFEQFLNTVFFLIISVLHLSFAADFPKDGFSFESFYVLFIF